MSFPFSVLRSKKEKRIIIEENKEDILEFKTITNDFDNIFTDIIEKGLYVTEEQKLFVITNKNNFYRNNLAVIFLSLNCLDSIRGGYDFYQTEQYITYENYISRNMFKNDVEDVKKRKSNFLIDDFRLRLKTEVNSYIDKINRIKNPNI